MSFLNNDVITGFALQPSQHNVSYFTWLHLSILAQRIPQEFSLLSWCVCAQPNPLTNVCWVQAHNPEMLKPQVMVKELLNQSMNLATGLAQARPLDAHISVLAATNTFAGLLYDTCMTQTCYTDMTHGPDSKHHSDVTVLQFKSPFRRLTFLQTMLYVDIVLKYCQCASM